MNKLFENETTYSSDTYVEFLDFHNKKFNFSYLAYTIAWSILLLFCMYLTFSDGNRLQGVILTIILICFLAYRFYRPRMIVHKELKSDKISTNNTNIFTFYDKIFKISNQKGTFTYRYFQLKKIYETSDFFYLYVTKENAFLVSKFNFTLGTPEDFATFLKNKCKFKYKNSQ